jgi:hypothetical protein
MSLAGFQETVAEMVSDGRDLEEVEGTIESARLGEEEKSALWLLAWSYRDRRLSEWERAPAPRAR